MELSGNIAPQRFIFGRRTRTIQALALYVADQMKQRLATLFD
jgi:hypothetical protein